ncbi:TetR/AcrR family transcriptional regulator [Streptomyces antnestii]|uniref:TetR/AcrR family transcriptional regulator n=1 Tax=Streptomyces antnestii TaxID=2494256 RepID=A0A3S2VJK3_9ACTN|nr:TetR/AcrR family transcriptional regulator [Streptomyces sp. San01]RVU27381.1 TetR/AcrR family transcriptional regulator [Streptomyces sp. San01]
MARQERAEQTRRRLIEAAAAEFAAHGYAGTSLLGIVKSAGVTMGALTFHFASKSALADAVQEAGAAATRAVLHDDRPGGRTPGLEDVLGDTMSLAAALETTPSIRAAARFTREGRDADSNWYAAWVPHVRAGLERGWPDDCPGSGLTPVSAAALLTYVMAGVEATTAAHGALREASGGDDPRDDLARALQALTALAGAAG